ncbi:MAG: CDP-alcohol phosphatidyltransferase family protein [Actinomycetota bacterium]|nr:CDP-alcohol phosphatidyltransferase family protein [Actinomycetota bacterium]
MAQPTVSNKILTIPNVISFVRLIGVGVFWWVLLVKEDIAMAAWFIFIIGWTDWIDGYLARRLNQVTALGKALDPVADRLMIASAVVGGLIANVVPAVVGWPLIAREIFMGGLALRLWAKGAGTLEVRYLGKLATAWLYGAIPAFYLGAAGVVPWLFNGLGWLFGVAGLAVYWFVAFQYASDAKKVLTQVESASVGEEN